MKLFNKLLDIYKLIIKITHSYSDNNLSQRKFDVLSNEMFYTLDNTYNKLENTYYTNVMFPQLENIWYIEKQSIILCITCIMHVLNMH